MSEEETQEPGRPQIRTFYRDLQNLDLASGGGALEEVLRTENMITAKARAKKRTARANIIWIVSSIVLLLAIFVVSILAAVFSEPDPVGQGPDLPGLFVVDYNLRLNTTGTNTIETLGEYANQNYVSPSVIRVVPEDSTLMSFRESAEALWPNAPLLLTTSVSPQFMFGYHTEKRERNPFLVLLMLNLADATNAMKEWEDTLYDDLSTGFGLNRTVLARPTWRNEVVLNLPVRSLYFGTTIEVDDVIRTPVITSVVTTTETGATTTLSETTYIEETITTVQPGPSERVLFYSIINGAYIIISTDPNTLEEIINRLAQGA